MFLAPRVMFLILKSVIFLANSLVWTLSYNQVISHDANEHFYLCCISLLLMPLHFTVGESIENFLIPGALPFFPQFFFGAHIYVRRDQLGWLQGYSYLHRRLNHSGKSNWATAKMRVPFYGCYLLMIFLLYWHYFNPLFYCRLVGSS